jgi:hypothetical protein
MRGIRTEWEMVPSLYIPPTHTLTRELIVAMHATRAKVTALAAVIMHAKCQDRRAGCADG